MNADDVLGAVHHPTSFAVLISYALALLSTRCSGQRGAKMFEHTGVTGILTAFRKKVVGVETDNGTIRCEAVALCTTLKQERPDDGGRGGSRLALRAFLSVARSQSTVSSATSRMC